MRELPHLEFTKVAQSAISDRDWANVGCDDQPTVNAAELLTANG
jgi:hypothetical protein